MTYANTSNEESNLSYAGLGLELMIIREPL